MKREDEEQCFSQLRRKGQELPVPAKNGWAGMNSTDGL